MVLLKFKALRQQKAVPSAIVDDKRPASLCAMMNTVECTEKSVISSHRPNLVNRPIQLSSMHFFSHLTAQIKRYSLKNNLKKLKKSTQRISIAAQ
jgi:hypothetical protein